MSAPVDKRGIDAASFTQTPDGLVPVIEHRHKVWMVKDLYAAGWSYRLIAQALNWNDDDVREALFS